MEHFMVSNDKRVTLYTVILVLCATSDEKPGDAAGRGAKKGIAMQTLA